MATESKQVLESGVTTAWGSLNYAFLNAGKFYLAYLIVLLAFPFIYFPGKRVLRWRMRGKSDREQITLSQRFPTCWNKPVSFRCREFCSNHLALPSSFFGVSFSSYSSSSSSSSSSPSFFLSFDKRFFMNVYDRTDIRVKRWINTFVGMTRGADNTRINTASYHDIYSRHISSDDNPPIHVISSQTAVSRARITTNLDPTLWIIPRQSAIAFSLSVIISA